METPPFAQPPVAPEHKKTPLIVWLLVGLGAVMLCLCVAGFGVAAYYLEKQSDKAPVTMEGYGEPEVLARRDGLWSEYRISEAKWRLEMPGSVRPAGRTFQRDERRYVDSWSGYEFGYHVIGGDMYITQYHAGTGYTASDFTDGELVHMRAESDISEVKTEQKTVSGRPASVTSATWRYGGVTYDTVSYYWVSNDLMRSIRLTWEKGNAEGKAAHDRVLKSLTFED